MDVLVLERKTGEVVMIGENIKVMVCRVNGDRVKIGIEAPSDIPVHRREVYLEIKETKPVA